MQENLISRLCGEAYITLDPEFQFILTANLEGELPPKEELLPENTYTVKITDACFSTKHGRLKDMENEFFWLFTCTTEDNHVERPTQQTIKAIHHPEPDTMFPLTRVLLAQLAWGKTEDENIDWNAELRRRPFPSNGTAYRNILKRGIDLGIVHHVINQIPQTNPAFLNPLRDAQVAG